MATAKKAPEELTEEMPVGEEMVTIKLPLTRDLKDDKFVQINNRNWLIKRGEYVTVPKCVVEVLDHAEEAEREAILYQDAHVSKEG